MSKTSIADLDVAPANNTDINAVGISGSDNVSKGDDALRAYGALIARFYDSMGAVATVSGTNTLTVTITEDWTAYATGMILAIKAANANTGAVTLNVTPAVASALGAKAIRLAGDTALSGGEMVANGVYLLRYDAAYNSAAGAWVLLNPQPSAYLPLAGGTLTGNLVLQALLDISASGAGQIRFPATQHSSSGANDLDDYQDSVSWTPAFSATGCTFSYATQTGRALKIGRLVVAPFEITLNTSGNTLAGNGLSITGLPYAPENTGLTHVNYVNWGNLGTSYVQVGVGLGVGSTTMAVWGLTAAAATFNNVVVVANAFLSATAGSTIRGILVYRTDS